VKIPHVSIRMSAILAAISLAAGAALFSAFMAVPALGQGAPNAQNIAVIDISQILKKDTKFNQQLAAMKVEATAVEKEIRDGAAQIQSMQNQQKTFAPGSPDYQRLDTDIAKATADLQLKKNLKQKEFIERQSKMLYNTYREIQDAVKEFSARYNIGLVVQYESSPIDSANPEAILAGAHRNVVYVNPGLDITGDILAMLNRSNPVPPPVGPNGVNVGGANSGVLPR